MAKAGSLGWPWVLSVVIELLALVCAAGRGRGGQDQPSVQMDVICSLLVVG